MVTGNGLGCVIYNPEPHACLDPHGGLEKATSDDTEGFAADTDDIIEWTVSNGRDVVIVEKLPSNRFTSNLSLFSLDFSSPDASQ